MKQVIPFEYVVNFKTELASITSISLEHEEQIKKGEVSGNFIIYGNYKEHTDTTEEELFKYRIPFTTIIPDNISLDTVIVDIENFTYNIESEKTLKVNIDYLVSGEEMIIVDNEEKNRNDEETVKFDDLPKIIEEARIENKEEKSDEDMIIRNEQVEEINKIEEEYITYHIHIVSENETVEDMIKKYETTIDNVRNYNDITNIKVGDKILIPELLND